MYYGYATYCHSCFYNSMESKFCFKKKPRYKKKTPNINIHSTELIPFEFKSSSQLK